MDCKILIIGYSWGISVFEFEVWIKKLGHIVNADVLCVSTVDNILYKISGIDNGGFCSTKSKFLEFEGLRYVLENYKDVLTRYNLICYINNTAITKHSALAIEIFTKDFLDSAESMTGPWLAGRVDSTGSKKYISTYFFLGSTPVLQVMSDTFQSIEKLCDDDAVKLTGDYLSNLLENNYYKTKTRKIIFSKLYDRLFEIELSRNFLKVGSIQSIYPEACINFIKFVAFVKNFFIRRMPYFISKFLYKI